MKEVDEKVFLLIASLKQLGFIEFEKDFCEVIGLKKQNLNNIKNGLTHFTIQHLFNISKKYNANPNYFFGLEENMYRKKSK
jgi:transcriptional regulator with XRE-family HTH domain